MRTASSLVLVTTTLFLLNGCAPASPPHVPQVPAATAVTKSECVDIRATLAEDEHIEASSALVWFEFWNRCEEAVMIDWSAANASGVAGESGVTTPLMLYNPGEHIRLGRIDGKGEASEAFRFDVRSQNDKDARFDRVCVDLSRVISSEAPRVVCVNKPGDSSVVDMGRSGFREAHETHPHTVHGVVVDGGGYGSSFGMGWDTEGFPRFVLESGLSMHQINLHDIPRLKAPSSARVDGGQIADKVVSGELDLRLKGFFHGPFYTGIDLGAGFGGAHGTVVTASSGEQIPVASEASGHIRTGAFVGITGRVHNIQPFAEIGGGIRGVIFSERANPDGSSSASTSGKKTLDAWWGTITPRGGIDVWVLPNLTVGGFVEVDALHTGNLGAGLQIGGHIRAFDGR